MTGLPLPHRVFERFLPSATHASLLAWALDQRQRFAPALVDGGRLEPEVRRALSLRDLGSVAPELNESMAALVPGLIAQLRVTPFDLREIELELVAYGDGAHFGRHTDTYTRTPSARGDRMLSAVYYLFREPKRFSGGELRLYDFGPEDSTGGHVDVTPQQNSLVVFPSWGPHEVRPVSVPTGDFADSRFAVNAWFYRRSPVTSPK